MRKMLVRGDETIFAWYGTVKPEIYILCFLRVRSAPLMSTGGCRHRLRFLLSPGLAGSPEWIIRHGRTRGRRDRAIVGRMQKALVHS
jgi:hypothetical protein